MPLLREEFEDFDVLQKPFFNTYWQVSKSGDLACVFLILGSHLSHDT